MRITQLNHVAIHVIDMERSVRFYRDVLGLTAMARPAFSFPGAWFKVGADQELHLIGKNAETASPPRERHYAFMVDDINAYASRLTQERVTFTGLKLRPDGAQQIFLEDPDGHVVELCTPPGCF